MQTVDGQSYGKIEKVHKMNTYCTHLSHNIKIEFSSVIDCIVDEFAIGTDIDLQDDTHTINMPGIKCGWQTRTVHVDAHVHVGNTRILTNSVI